jgi:tetratricopeptide (TPR) repeat protein
MELHRQLALTPTAGDAELESARHRAQRPEAKAEAWVVLGQAWVKKARATGDPGYYLSAEAAAEVALSLSPRFRPALGLKALALLNGHKFREARDLAKQILADAPDDLIALGALSDALLELGDIPGATDAVQKMMDAKPSLPSYSRASYLRWLRGDEGGARELIRLAIDAGRGARDREPSAWTLIQAAMIFWHAGDLEGADAGFDEALRQLPDYAPALVGKARVALAKGEKGARRAVDLLERALAATPTVEALWLLVDALELAGRPAETEKVVTRILREGRRGDRLGLASFLAAKGKNIDEALALLASERRDRAGGQDPEANRANLYVEDAYSWALYRAGRFEEARAASDRACALGTPDARLLFHAGAIRLAQGQTDAGKRLLKQALARNPAFDVSGAAGAQRLLAGAGPRATVAGRIR